MTYTRPQVSFEQARQSHETAMETIDRFVNARLEAMGVTSEPDRSIFRRDVERSMRHAVRVADTAETRMEYGIDTRHGGHVRHKKLRKGVRNYDHGESFVVWWVCEAPRGLLAYTRRNTVESAGHGYASEKRELYEEALRDIVADQHSDYPHASQPGPGQWGASIYAKQVGNRLLVKQRSYLNV